MTLISADFRQFLLLLQTLLQPTVPSSSRWRWIDCERFASGRRRCAVAAPPSRDAASCALSSADAAILTIWVDEEKVAVDNVVDVAVAVAAAVAIAAEDRDSQNRCESSKCSTNNLVDFAMISTTTKISSTSTSTSSLMRSSTDRRAAARLRPLPDRRNSS